MCVYIYIYIYTHYRGREKYSGQWAANQYHGAGTQVDASGSLYEGEWCEGKFHGVGKHAQGAETYTGEFQHGERHGEGQLVRTVSGQGQDGLGAGGLLGAECLFAGQWRGGRRDGHGKAIYERGEYDGDWVGSSRHGQGILSQAGYQLEGPWLENEPDAQGVHMVFYPNGAKYTGLLSCRRLVASGGKEVDMAGGGGGGRGEVCSWWAVPEGRGIMKTPEGQVYEGDHLAGLPHGQGMEMGADRGKYDGQFAGGLRHGDRGARKIGPSLWVRQRTAAGSPCRMFPVGPFPGPALGLTCPGALGGHRH